MANYPSFDSFGTDATSRAGVNNGRVYETEGAVATLMRNVYIWMALALVITGFTAYYVASSYSLIYAIATNQILFWGIAIAEIGLVFYLSARINSISFTTAGLLFAVYSILNGVTMSILLLVYTMSSVATTFFITAGTFGAMALVGSFTKKDLGFIGKFALMAVIGLIIASVVNMFVHSEGFELIISYAGVLIFSGLTAYDSQKIKNMIGEYGTEVTEGTQKLALMGALTLYLDFINMFIYLLRIFGNRRS